MNYSRDARPQRSTPETSALKVFSSIAKINFAIGQYKTFPKQYNTRKTSILGI